MSSGNVHGFEFDDVTPTAESIPDSAISTPTVLPHDGASPGGALGGTVMADPPFWRMIGKRNDREAWRDRSL
ncbi:MAG TPA: hypothetical protein VEA69_26010 [Tepidisphaeraceae bacterium]|nr:hypothetical protein [Tepidisphaeraceae bacterium]